MRFGPQLLIGAALAVSGCSVVEQTEEPTLRVASPITATPGPDETTLELLATGVDTCGGAEEEVVDVAVLETEAEVVIEAGLRVTPFGFCEIRTARETFTVKLDRTLGRRRVIDDSTGDRSVIWSPQMRRDILRRRQVRAQKAEEFLRAKFPSGENPRCMENAPTRFLCTVGAPPRGKPVEFYVLVGRGAELKALAAEQAASKARQALTRRP